MRPVTNENEYKKFFKHVSARLKHAPTCTYTRINGSIVHAGSGIAENQVSSMLLWRGRPPELKEMYDLDVHETRITVMIKIIQHIWHENPHLKHQMVGFVYHHIFQTCNAEYRKVVLNLTEKSRFDILKRFTEVKGVAVAKDKPEYVKPEDDVVYKMIEKLARTDIFAKTKDDSPETKRGELEMTTGEVDKEKKKQKTNDKQAFYFSFPN
jgi:hypothetical protein